MNKEELRKHYIAVCDGIPEGVRNEKSRVIQERFLELEEFKAAEAVMVYMSLGSEVSTLYIAERVLDMGKTLVVPKCVPVSRTITPYAINSLDDLEVGYAGIPEPKISRGNMLQKTTNIDIIAVPAVALDREGYRIGYGGGYYDRFLADYGGFAVGLGFDECWCGELPRDEYDRAVDLVLTE